MREMQTKGEAREVRKALAPWHWSIKREHRKPDRKRQKRRHR